MSLAATAGGWAPLVRICLLSQRCPYMTSFSSDIVAQRGAIQRDAGEQALGARPREDLGRHERVGLGCGVAAHRAGGGGGFAADGEFAWAESLACRVHSSPAAPRRSRRRPSESRSCRLRCESRRAVPILLHRRRGTGRSRDRTFRRPGRRPFSNRARARCRGLFSRSWGMDRSGVRHDLGEEAGGIVQPFGRLALVAFRQEG